MNKIIERKTLISRDRDLGGFQKFLYRNFIGRLILKLLIRPCVSKLGGFYMNRKCSKGMIKKFVKKNNIDLSQYDMTNIKCYNDFFTRKIIDGARNINMESNKLISPCDSKLQAFKINEESIFNIKDSYYKTIENRLVLLTGDRIKKFNKQKILDMFKYHKIKDFIDIWVDKKDRSEFKTLLLIYRNDSYFYKLYSSFETKQLINFSNDTNVKTLGISVIITIISLFLSIYPIINDWSLFIRKVALLIVPAILIIAAMIFNFKNQKKLMIVNYKFDTIYISSAIAKIKNSK